MPASVRVAPARLQESLASQRMTSVLIVDDSDEIRRVVRAVVSDVADVIYECRDGDEACTAYAVHQPDWVLMDISMERMDGLSATRHIVRSFPAARIVMVTQYEDVRFRRAATEAGACGYVLKSDLLGIRRYLTAPE
jgi:CheY-like chemotaxis protein